MALSEREEPAVGAGGDATLAVSVPPESPTLGTPPHFGPSEGEEYLSNPPSLGGELEEEEAEERTELTELEVVEVEVVHEGQEEVEVVEEESEVENGGSEQGVCYAEAERKMRLMQQRRRCGPR